MKVCLQNKTPILTKEIKPSWYCPDRCCFKRLCVNNNVYICNYFQKQCTKEYSYTLKDNISDIFTL